MDTPLFQALVFVIVSDNIIERMSGEKAQLLFGGAYVE